MDFIGKEAILRSRQSINRNDHYSVYIIDWLLPDMNGIKVARRIRQEAKEDVPIIVLTAYDWSDIEEEAKNAGITTFCSKPIFFSELYKCLYSIINASKKLKTDNEIHEPISTGRILLVEDNELNQEIAKEWKPLCMMELSVEHMTGKEAIEIAKKKW